MVQNRDTIPAVSAHVTTDHSLQGTITGIPARFLVDTGAAASILNKQGWVKVSKQQEASLEVVSGRNLIGVEESPLKILGAVHLQVIFERQQFNVCFLVADSLTTEAILGRVFLKDNSCVIDVEKNLITFGNVGFTLKLNCLAGDSQIAHVSITLSNTLQVPACCEVEVMVNVPDGIAGGTWIVEGNTSTRQALLVARTLVTPTSKAVPVRLLDPRPELVKVTSGTVVARMESVKPIEVPVVGMTQLSDNISEVSEVKTQLIESMVNQLGSHVSNVQQQLLLELLMDFADIFAATPEDLGRTNTLNHQIDTGDAKPIRQPLRRIPPAKRKQTQKLLQKLLEKDIIQPSSSPWASPIVLVQKKDGSQQFCVDYRKLNSVTKKDAYPIPRIDDTLDTLAGSHWFSTLDLVSGY